MKTYPELEHISNIFFEKCSSLAIEKPWAVCLAMHEYARHLYPSDPYIPFDQNDCPTERLYKITKNLIQFINISNKFGHYLEINSILEKAEVKKKTGKVYGKLWEKFNFKNLTEDAIEIINTRFNFNNLDLNILKGKKAIDVGCGSGRFTFALKQLGCESVVGVDYGDDGLKVANQLIEKERIKSVKFLKHSVLDLPFEDESFDFVFCNGVLHHTENMEQGIKEIIRITKKSGHIWLYLYGNGGIFWHARKKMPEIMKKIPQDYTIAMLDLLLMPSNRFIFTDNWYVPIERHTFDAEARKIIKDFGINDIKRLRKGRSTDLEESALESGEIGKIMWGDGELRYILKK